MRSDEPGRRPRIPEQRADEFPNLKAPRLTPWVPAGVALIGSALWLGLLAITLYSGLF